MSDLKTLVSYLFEGSVNAEDASVKSESIKAGKLPNTADQYQKDAMRTCAIADKPGDMILHGVFGLNAEAGEVASIFQKHYQGHEIDHDHLIKECGDCLWMIAEILSAIDCSMSECMERNISKLKARYPEGFDPEKSLHRKAGDI